MEAVLARLRSVAGPSEDREVLADLEAADRRLGETVFRLVVLGEYKRGKTTLINALLGTPALPMAVVPLTSVVTEVVHGASPEAAVEFLTGESRTLPLTDLPAFVTEPENPQNRKGVRRATVRCPAGLLAEGVNIVDTPGIGSVFEHNSEVTYQFLEEADAVVIVLAADQPLSAEERSLLRALDGITDRILFAVNRVDILTPDEVAASVRFIRESLAALEERPPESVYPLSARQALEARMRDETTPAEFVQFETALHRVLIERKADILWGRAERLARKASDLLALRLQSERQSLRLGRGELERAIREFQTAASTMQRKLEDSGSFLKHRITSIPDVELQSVADETRERVMAALWPRAESTLRSRNDRSLRGVVRQLSAEIGEWVVEELHAYYPATERRALRAMEHALEEHAARVQAAVGEVVTLAGRLLGMRAEVPQMVSPALDRPRFFFKDWDYSGGQLRGSSWRLWLPRRWAEPYAELELRELLERRINQNLGAVRYDWVIRLEGAVHRYQVAGGEQLAAVVGVIREALDRAQRLAAEGGVEVRLVALDRQIEEVARARKELDEAFRREPPPLAGAPA